MVSLVVRLKPQILAPYSTAVFAPGGMPVSRIHIRSWVESMTTLWTLTKQVDAFCPGWQFWMASLGQAASAVKFVTMPTVLEALTLDLG